MVTIVPQVTNWSVTPQNGQVNYFTLMNTWLFESTSVISSLNNAITKINEASSDINEIGTNAINAIMLDTIEDLATYTGTGLVIVKDISRGGNFVSKTITEIDPNTGNLYTINDGTVFAKAGGGFWARQYSGAVNVKWFGAKGDWNGTTGTDDTLPFQKTINYIYSLTSGYLTPNLTIKIPHGTYLIGQTNGVKIPFNNNVLKLTIDSDGAKLIGTGANFCFKFNADSEPTTGGGYRNIFKKLEFQKFGTSVYWHTNNRDQCMIKFEDCVSYENDIFLDTVSYAESRSSMVLFKSFVCSETRVALKTYTDHTSLDDCWFYAKEGSYDALLYLGGDGNVSVSDTFFIPNSTQILNPVNSRFVDIYASGTANDRSLKTIKFTNCRASLESARPFIWYFDYNTDISGNNKACSITIQDSYIGSTGGDSVITYKQGYPAIVNFKNCKVLASPYIVRTDEENTYPPLPSSIGSITSHVINIDEATRLSQSNSNNTSAIIDPSLEPFYYDTTSQTSKYKTSIQKNIDYRLRAVATSNPDLVKCTIPIFFDTNPAVPNRGILSFILVTVGDAYGTAYSNPAYSSTGVTLVTIVGGNNGVSEKKIVATTLQDAAGGIGYGTSAVPSIFFGDGDTGSSIVLPSSSSGIEDKITFTWASSSVNVSWAYIIPLAGIRANQQDKMQFNVW